MTTISNRDASWLDAPWEAVVLASPEYPFVRLSECGGAPRAYRGRATVTCEIGLWQGRGEGTENYLSTTRVADDAFAHLSARGNLLSAVAYALASTLPMTARETVQRTEATVIEWNSLWHPIDSAQDWGLEVEAEFRATPEPSLEFIQLILADRVTVIGLAIFAPPPTGLRLRRLSGSEVEELLLSGALRHGVPNA